MKKLVILCAVSLTVLLLSSLVFSTGCPLRTSGVSMSTCVDCPGVISDGSGDAIAIWEDLRKGLTSVYAQRIDALGDIQWQPGGEEVCYIDRNSSFWPYMAVSDGAGNAIVSFGTRAQKIDAAGNMVWPANGVVFAGGGANSIACDRYGGIVVAWGESRRSYVQRLSDEGWPLWGNKGIKLIP